MANWLGSHAASPSGSSNLSLLRISLLFWWYFLFIVVLRGDIHNDSDIAEDCLAVLASEMLYASIGSCKQLGRRNLFLEIA